MQIYAMNDKINNKRKKKKKNKEMEYFPQGRRIMYLIKYVVIRKVLSKQSYSSFERKKDNNNGNLSTN
jgi:hypothetical protein